MFEVALFAVEDGGTRLVGRTGDPGLVQAVRDQLADRRREELRELVGPSAPPIRLVPEIQDTGE